MSTVSPVFHTEAKVSIGLKNILRVETPAFDYSLKTIIFCVLGESFRGGGGGGGDQNRRTDFENSVIRPVFHR